MDASLPMYVRLPRPIASKANRRATTGKILACYMSLVLVTLYLGAAAGVFDWLPFPGQPGYTNVVDGGIQDSTSRDVWSAPLKRPTPVNPDTAPTTEAPVPTTLASQTTKRTKRDSTAIPSDRIRHAAEEVLKHDLDLERAHLDGFRSAGLDEVTLQKLERQLRVELRRRKRSSRFTPQGIATTAGIAALQHVFSKFDLFPKAFKKTAHNPGYERGVPRGHARQLPYDFSGYANPGRPGLALGELSGGYRGGGHHGARGGRVPVTGIF